MSRDKKLRSGDVRYKKTNGNLDNAFTVWIYKRSAGPKNAIEWFCFSRGLLLWWTDAVRGKTIESRLALRLALREVNFACTGFAFSFERRKWNRGRNGLHQLGQPVAPSILFPGRCFISPFCTVISARMSYRKWRENKQHLI